MGLNRLPSDQLHTKTGLNASASGFYVPGATAVCRKYQENAMSIQLRHFHFVGRTRKTSKWQRKLWQSRCSKERWPL